MPNEPIYTCVAFEQITDISGSTGLTAANIPPTNKRTVYALVQVTTSDCRFRLDGSTTAPTDAIGHYLAQNGTIEVWGQKDLQGFRAIDVTASSKLEVHYFGSV